MVMNRYFLSSGLIILLLISCNITIAQFPTTRNVYKWPFNQTSIWNMPIGSNAVYIPANICQANERGMFIDEDILIFNKDAPLVSIYYSSAAWTGADRCVGQPNILLTVPIPPDFIVSPQNWTGQTPNSAMAVLMPDGVTLKQTQPFTKCFVGPSATTFVYSPNNDVNIYGDGILGAHGGSGLSSIGGTLRNEELMSPTDTIRHVLKINVWAQMNLSYSPLNQGFRWPAVKADYNAAGIYGSASGANPVPQCLMGALLALPLSMNIDNMGFETVPGKILARAFQTYGAYIVDNANWNVYSIATEWSHQGRFKSNFMAAWGFDFDIQSKNHPWARDMDRIFMNLAVVDNNTPFSIGGGGIPLAPLAPPFSVDVEEVKDPAGFSVYPNPASDRLYISLTGANDIPYQIIFYDVSGKVLLNKMIYERKTQLELMDFKSGYYTMSILSSSKISSYKIIRLHN